MADDASVAALFGLELASPRLQEALTHPSFANETKELKHYQRLEFLGDAVLGLCASESLFIRFPDADEGRLTRLRARLVNAEALAGWAREQGLFDVVRLGRGAETNGLASSTNVLCDMVEALIGATYLDCGAEAAWSACRRIIDPLIEGFETDAGRDPKSSLQEHAQRLGKALPVYEVVESGGPDHEPWFVVRVSVDSEVLAEGRGRSKRLAERAAAREAIVAGYDDRRFAPRQSVLEDEA
jgi:ribonuclease-3